MGEEEFGRSDPEARDESGSRGGVHGRRGVAAVALGARRHAAEDAAHEERGWVDRRRRKFLRCGLGCLRGEGKGRSDGEGGGGGARRGGEGGEGEASFLGRVGEGWNGNGGVFTICAYTRRKWCIVAVYLQNWNDTVGIQLLFFFLR